MRYRVLITDHIHPLMAEALADMGFEVDVQPEIDNSALKKIIAPYTGLVISTRTRVDQALVDAATSLKFIGRVGSGMEHVDTAYCTERGIRCFSSPEGNANAVGEHCLGLLLSVLNHISRSHRQMIGGQWIREANRGDELDGKTVGIIGYGHTGPAFARKLRGFDVRILVYDKYQPPAKEGQIIPSKVEEICRKADVISFHVPFTAETRHWINRSFLQSCEKEVVLLNTSRGAIAHTPDLWWGLESGKLRGLGLDVFEDEPIDKGDIYSMEIYHKILEHPLVVATPHIAGWSAQSKELLVKVLADKIARWWDVERRELDNLK